MTNAAQRSGTQVSREAHNAFYQAFLDWLRSIGAPAAHGRVRTYHEPVTMVGDAFEFVWYPYVRAKASDQTSYLLQWSGDTIKVVGIRDSGESGYTPENTMLRTPAEMKAFVHAATSRSRKSVESARYGRRRYFYGYR